MGDGFRIAALLLHELPGGARHFDFLLGLDERPDPEARRAACFRTDVRTDLLVPGSQARLESIELHRNRYLELAGEVALSEGRGLVRPLAQGRWRPLDDGSIELAWSPHAPRWSILLFRDTIAVDLRDERSIRAVTRLLRRA